MNVRYLQNIVFSFVGSNGQNHSFSDSHHDSQDSPSSYWGGGGGGFPLKNTGDGSIYIPPEISC